MPGTAQPQNYFPQSPRNDHSNLPDEILTKSLRSFVSRLNSSALAVCFFDEKLNCRAANTAFARIGVPRASHLGRSIQQIFGGKALELESVLHRVWRIASSCESFPWTASARPNRPRSNWLLNIYPIQDGTAQVRLIAAIFSEVTKRDCAELRLGRLAEKFSSDGHADHDSEFGDEFADLSVRSTELVKRSLALLKSSTALRCYAFETRIETELAKAAFSLAGTRRREVPPVPGESLHEPALADLESSNTNNLPTANPSPRERQLLLFLANGKSNKEIAAILSISTRTVETYRARIMTKLDLHSTAALVRYAIRERIIEA